MDNFFLLLIPFYYICLDFFKAYNYDLQAFEISTPCPLNKLFNSFSIMSQISLPECFTLDLVAVNSFSIQSSQKNLTSSKLAYQAFLNDCLEINNFYEKSFQMPLLLEGIPWLLLKITFTVLTVKFSTLKDIWYPLFSTEVVEDMQ